MATWGASVVPGKCEWRLLKPCHKPFIERRKERGGEGRGGEEEERGRERVG